MLFHYRGHKFIKSWSLKSICWFKALATAICLVQGHLGTIQYKLLSFHDHDSNIADNPCAAH